MKPDRYRSGASNGVTAREDAGPDATFHQPDFSAAMSR
jgi:hypothetical protein